MDEASLGELEGVQQRFQALIEHGKDLIALIDDKGVIQYVSPSVQRILGYEPETLLGTSSSSLIHDDDAASLTRAFGEILRGNSMEAPIIVRMRGNDGWIHIMETTLTNMLDHPAVGAIVVNLRDITEQRRARVALEESQQRIRTLYENIPAGSIIIGSDYRIHDVNDRTCAITGYERDELVGEFCDIVCPKGKLSQKCPIWEEGSEMFRGMETTIKCKRGAPKEIIKNAKRIQLRGETYILENFIDITHRIRIETELRKSEERFRAFIDSSSDLVFLKDSAFGHLIVNRSYIDFLDRDEESIIGRSDFELLPEKVARNCRRSDEEALNQNRTVVTMEEVDGRIFETRKFPVPLEDGTVGVGGMIRDVTERIRAEEELHMLEVQIAQQQKLEALGTLAGGVAHEINNPVNIIMNYAQIIKDRLEGGSELVEFTDEIMHETDRVATIVRNLLSFARRDTEGMVQTTMGDIVESTASLINSILRRDHITLVLDIPPEVPNIVCHSEQIQQVIMNMVTNARDALNERFSHYHREKKIEIAVEAIDKPALDPEVPWLRITVEDNGAGIAPSARKHIFEPFFTTKPRERGTGLGLSVSHGLVNKHGGEIRFETEVGKGTIFTIELPTMPIDRDGI